MAAAIEGMTKVGGYNYDWGSVNQPDMAKRTYPSALILLGDPDGAETAVENLDEVGSGAGQQLYHQRALFTIIVQGEITSETTNPNYSINPVHVKALDDLLELFGTNFAIGDTCDKIMFRTMRRNLKRTGDIFKPGEMPTAWDVYYQQDRTNPEQIG